MAKKNFIQLANIKTGSFREQLGLKENQKVVMTKVNQGGKQAVFEIITDEN